MSAAAVPDSTAARPSMSRIVALTMGGRIVYLASRVALPPIILSDIGLEEYGIWACCFVLISYLGMSAFGVSNVYIRYVAEYHARGDTERVNRLVSTGLLVTGAIGVVVLVALWFALPTIIHLFKISATLQDKALMMENAGKGLAEVVAKVYAAEKSGGALGLVGSGNNGGDTLVALAILAERGWKALRILYALDRWMIV